MLYNNYIDLYKIDIKSITNESYYYIYFKLTKNGFQFVKNASYDKNTLLVCNIINDSYNTIYHELHITNPKVKISKSFFDKLCTNEIINKEIKKNIVYNKIKNL